MPTSEPLVPNDLPKGSRAQVREGMQRAGIPLSPRVPARRSSPGALSSGASPPLGLDLASLTPDDFPFLQDTPPVDEPITSSGQNSVVAALSASAQSEFAQAVLNRLAGK